jgi:hypothetical protein
MQSKEEAFFLDDLMLQNATTCPVTEIHMTQDKERFKNPLI